MRARLTGAELYGSVLLPVEILAKPQRTGAQEEFASLVALLRTVSLVPLTMPLVSVATTLAVDFNLRTVDAVHLATAAQSKVDVFYTNNRRDFAGVSIPGLSVESPSES